MFARGIRLVLALTLVVALAAAPACGIFGEGPG